MLHHHRPSSWSRACLVLALVALGAPAFASGPMSVWATLDLVRIEQTRGEAPRVTLEGSFVPFDGRTATVGRVVYVCKETDASVCLKAWLDLAKAAQAGTCVGWGQRPEPAPKPTPLADPAPSPLPWPVGMGVMTSTTRCKSAVRND